MQPPENEPSAFTLPGVDRDETPKSNYEPVRYNAMKHGILSELVVLAHEDHAQFSDLLAALVGNINPRE